MPSKLSSFGKFQTFGKGAFHWRQRSTERKKETSQMVQVSPVTVAARQGHCQQKEKKKLLCVSSFQLENFLRVPSTVATSIGLSPLSSVKVRVSDPQAVVKLASGDFFNRYCGSDPHWHVEVVELKLSKTFGNLSRMFAFWKASICLEM